MGLTIPTPPRLVWLLLLCSILALNPWLRAVAMAEEATASQPAWVNYTETGLEWFKTASDGLGTLATAPASTKVANLTVGSLSLKTKDFDSLLLGSAELHAGGDLTKYDHALIDLANNSKYLSAAEFIDKAMPFFDAALSAAKVGLDYSTGQYKLASQDAATGVIDAATYIPEGAISLVFAEALAGVACASLGPVSLAICFGVFAVAASYGLGQLNRLVGDSVGGAIYCGRRPEDPLCNEKTAAGPGMGPPSGPPGPGPSPTSQDSGNGGGRAGGFSANGTSIGSARITVTTGNVLASASDGGTAVNTIGSLNSSGTVDVHVGNVVTSSTGQSASTSIGASPGSVSAHNIYNEGGDLTLGGNGMVSRDGRPCVDIYLQHCIVYIYPRPHNQPCAYGYWYKPVTNMCELPADDKHIIGAVAP